MIFSVFLVKTVFMYIFTLSILIQNGFYAKKSSKEITNKPGIATVSSTTVSKAIVKPLSGWSEWRSWEICVLEKKRRHYNNSVQIIQSNISCYLICKY
jgi:hypothetical protein